MSHPTTPDRGSATTAAPYVTGLLLIGRRPALAIVRVPAGEAAGGLTARHVPEPGRQEAA
jgi:hypothetical protein